MTHSPDLSLTEFEALCYKAARGAGLDWGLAEEAGKAARWLYALGVDAGAILLGALAPNLGSAPGCTGDNWSAQDALCPIRTGAALVDYAPLGAMPKTISKLRQPVMIMPFLAQAARLLDCQFDITVFSHRIIVTPQTLLGNKAAFTALLHMDEASLQIDQIPALDLLQDDNRFAAIDVETIAALDALGARTYVPASASSRDSGAGAGTLDND